MFNTTIKPRTEPRRKRLNDPAFPVQLAERKGEKVRKATRNPLIGDEEHKDWLLTLGSVISGLPAEVCHHLLRTPTHEKGMGSKSSEGWLLPFTNREHDNLHFGKEYGGDETRYLAAHNIHGPSLAALLRQLSGQPVEVAQRAVRQHKEAMAGRTQEALRRVSAPTP